MAKAYTKISRTTDGKYFGQVRRLNGTTVDILHETSEYLTEEMAQADANCWKAFHVTKEAKPEFSVEPDDRVQTLKSRNGVPESIWTGEEFAGWLTGMTARFPEMSYRVGTEFDRRKTKGNDFFIMMRVRPDGRERCFIVKKGGAGFHLNVRVGATPVRKYTTLKADKMVSLVVEFVYYTDVADGSTSQRRTASLDVEVSKDISEGDVIKSAWEVLTRNWDKNCNYLQARVIR